MVPKPPPTPPPGSGFVNGIIRRASGSRAFGEYQHRAMQPSEREEEWQPSLTMAKPECSDSAEPIQMHATI